MPYLLNFASERRSTSFAWCFYPPTELPPGYLLADHYRIEATLQIEECAQLYRAVDKQTGLTVKLKRIPLGEDDEFTWREVEILSGLNHPRLPKAHKTFEEDGYLYFVQSFLEGPTLRHHFKTWGRLPKNRLVPVMHSVLEVLDYLHTRPVPVIHRDVKPANLVMLEPDQVGLIDFDIARLGIRLMKDVDLEDLTIAYTPGYAPPEQISGREAFPASDLYSLAASMIYASTGVHPVHLWNAQQGRIVVPAGYSGRIRELLTWLLEPSLDKRCPSAREALNAI